MGRTVDAFTRYVVPVVYIWNLPSRLLLARGSGVSDIGNNRLQEVPEKTGGGK